MSRVHVHGADRAGAGHNGHGPSLIQDFPVLRETSAEPSGVGVHTLNQHLIHGVNHIVAAMLALPFDMVNGP